jgi:hypothetical protein
MTPSAVPSRRDIIATAAAVAATKGCAVPPHRPGTLRYLLRRNVQTFDPALSPEMWIMSALFDRVPHP